MCPGVGYAAHRRPSTSTLAVKKTKLAAETTPIELSSEAVALLSVSPALPALISNAVAEALSQNRRVDGITTTLSAFTQTGSVTLSLKHVLIGLIQRCCWWR